MNNINEGCFYILHRDHGNVDGWSDPEFKVNNILDLSNNSKLPIVFSMNCLTGRYQDSLTEECFAKALLKKEKQLLITFNYEKSFVISIPCPYLSVGVGPNGR
ncbi:MAG: hypothetical protein E7091_07405 [Bacteroidales bacterium]|nr:hypothetical protein [Bacteroidales bacterium]